MTSVDPKATMTLTANLSRLGLTYTADSLNDLIARATRSRWSPTVLLDTLVQAELDARARRRLERQLQAARLGRFKPLADFEWTWPTLLHRPTVDRVFSLDFLAKGENVVLVASQGLGKTMLTKNLLLQVISRRYEQRSIVVTTNLLFKQWDTVFSNASCAVALIDRLTHHAEIIPIEGESYRKREAELTQKKRRAAP